MEAISSSVQVVLDDALVLVHLVPHPPPYNDNYVQLLHPYGQHIMKVSGWSFSPHTQNAQLPRKHRETDSHFHAYMRPITCTEYMKETLPLELEM